MTETPETFPDPEIPTIISATVVKRPKMEAYITHLKKKKNYTTIHKKLRKKGVYETDIHKIYNNILGHKNKQVQKKA